MVVNLGTTDDSIYTPATAGFLHTEKLSSPSQSPRFSVSAARAAAFDILLRVERESSYASDLLHSKAFELLSSQDHALATELVMGVLRWLSSIDASIVESSAQPLSRLDLEVLTALRLAIYQLGWLDRVPARAAIHESVELVKRARKRSAAPFVNAVLRKISKSGIRLARIQTDAIDAAHLGKTHAHPAWLVERWVAAYGLDSAQRICEYDQKIPEIAIRLRRPEAEKQLVAAGFDLRPGAFLASARRISRGDVTRVSDSLAGSWTIHDEASQLVAALVGKAKSFLDCCAAPGGKTAAIADRNPDASIAAVELHPHRARLLQNLLRGRGAPTANQLPNVAVTAADARELPFATVFDRVLADVPCSGTGTLARNPEIKWRLKPDDLADLQTRQVAILRSAMARVAPGGRLIYSTCSLEKEENEDVVALASQGSSFGIVDCGVELLRLKKSGELIWAEIPSLVHGKYLRTLPGVHPCDGFFAAILEKT